MFLGIQDPWVSLAFVLCIASCILCVVYGALNWNKGGAAPDAEDKRWATEEDKLDKEL